MDPKDPYWYLHIGRASDLTGSDRVLYRFFEMLPGLLSIGTLFLFVTLSFVKPVWAAYLTIIFSVYWLFKTTYLSIHLRHNFKRLRHNLRVDWSERLKDLRHEHIIHLVMFPFYMEGYEVVYGKIVTRDEGFVLRNLRKLYYYLIDSFSEVPIPQGAGEFRITSRRVLDALLSYHEDDLYIRGAIARIGFKQKPIHYERLARHKGESSNNYLRLISYAINGFVSTSVAPIRLVSTFGIIFSSIGFLLTILIILTKIFYPESAPRGFATLAVLVTFFAGLQLLGIGIIGEYMRKTYLQVLSRPLGFIEKSKNLDL